MSLSVHLSCNKIPGYLMLDGQSFSGFAVSGKIMAVSPYTSSANCRIPSHVKVESPKCITRKASFVCEATSGGRSRKPDFSGQKRHVFRGRNRQTEQRDNNGFFDNQNETEILSSRNGPSLSSLSNSSKFHATAAPGTREKEIVELFKKVRAKLRERAAEKKEKRVEEISQERGKESETVNSLLKLLRKHSGEQEKRRNSSFSGHDFGLDQTEDNSAYDTDQRTRFSKRIGKVVDEVEEINISTSSLVRPASSFRKKSPVPQSKPQLSQSDENTINPLPQFDAKESKSNKVSLLDELEYDETEPEADQESKFELESVHQNEDEVVVGEADLDEVSDDGSVDVDDVINDDDDDDDDESQEGEIEHQDLRALRLVELRALAKSRGVKGFSKMKKGELVELLS